MYAVATQNGNIRKISSPERLEKFRIIIGDLNKMSFLIAQIIGLVGTGLSLTVVQLKKISHIMIGEIAANAIVAITYLILGGYSGAAICSITITQAGISYILAKKDKSFKWQYTIIFVLLYAISSVYSYQSPIDILPFIGAVLSVCAIMQKKPARYRIFMMLNSMVWIAYDIDAMAYTTLLTHGLLLVSIMMAMIRMDRNK